MPIIQDLPLNDTVFPHSPYVEFHYHNTTELYKYLMIFVSQDPLFASGFVWTYNDQQSSGIYVRTTFPSPIDGTWYWKVNYTTDGSGETPVFRFFVNPPLPVVADFTAAPLSFFESKPVQFTDLSTGSPTSWSWKKRPSDSNDAFVEFSTVQNPSQVFSLD